MKIIDYPELMTKPEKIAEHIREFIGPDRFSAPNLMTGVVDPALYRQQIARRVGG